MRDGNLYARGSADDKGQMYMHIKAVEALRAVNGTLPVNLKFLIEGEEEVGGESIAKYVAENPAKLKADVALVSDTELYAEGIPTLCIGLRGLIYTEIEARGPARDLHSGLYGGAAPNAVFGLIELLAKLKDANGTIQIPGMYDDVEPPAAGRKTKLDHAAVQRKGVSRRTKSARRSSPASPAIPVLERVWARPTLEVHGIAGGFTGAGAKTVIPAQRHRQGQHAPGAQSGSRENHRGVTRNSSQENTPAGIQTEVRVLSCGPGHDGESRSSRDRRRRQGVRRRSGTRDGVHPQRRLDSDRGRFREAPGHSRPS